MSGADIDDTDDMADASGADDIEAGDYPLKAWAKRSRRPINSLLAQVGNTDPYAVGVPYRRVPAEWFARLYYELKAKPGSHVRRIFYIFVSQQRPILLPSGKRPATLDIWV